MTSVEPRKPYGYIANITDEKLDLYEKALKLGMQKGSAVRLLDITDGAWRMARIDIGERLGFEHDEISLEEIDGHIKTLTKEPKKNKRDINILRVLRLEKGPAYATGELQMLQRLEQASLDPKNYPAAIAMLKMAYGYSDKQELKVSGQINNSITLVSQQEKQDVAHILLDAGAHITPELEGELIEDD